MTKHQEDWWRQQVKSLLSGAIGGACLVAVGHPFDLLKVKLQTENHNSLVALLRAILNDHGLRGLYRGVSAPLLGVTPIFAICFWGYDIGMRLAEPLISNETGIVA